MTCLFALIGERVETLSLATIGCAFKTGVAKWWLSAKKGRGRLVLSYELRNSAGFASAFSGSAPGALALISKFLPRIDGSDATLRVTPIERAWTDATDSILDFFNTAGLSATIHDRSLQFQSPDATGHFVERVGLCLLALDIETRQTFSDEAMNELRLSAVKLFDADPEPILLLLDAREGEKRVSELLLKPYRSEMNRHLEGSVLSTLEKLNARMVIQFQCGSGWLLRRIAHSSARCAVTGIESSLRRVARAKDRLDGVGEVHHGSLIEPPRDIETNGIALLLKALPDIGDSRLERAARLLCERGFEWVIAAEDATRKSAADHFAALCSEGFAYKKGTWNVGSSGYVALLRRTPDSPPRLNHFQVGSPREIETRTSKRIRLSEEQWASTLEAFSLRTVDPKWLIYLPSGIASLQRDREDGLLEHPQDAFAYYRDERVFRVVVETKHMGSRAIVVICRDEQVARERFGKAELGTIYTRNGRPFFDDPSEVLGGIHDGLTRARFWERFQTGWACLDGEILPWSVKAQRLISEDHRDALEASQAILREIERLQNDIGADFGETLEVRRESLERYSRLLEKYEGEASSPIAFAPFHLVAVEGRTFFDKNHHWHMQTLNALVRRAGKPFLGTRYETLDVRDEKRVDAVLAWWDELSASGEEGLVIKPLHFVCRGRRGQAQPAIKCRGKEHLRLVYGPDYDAPENRLRLLDRPALARRRQKHRRILRQFALSIEGVERFVRKEELSRIEECVRGVLSLETREVFPEEQPV